MVVVYLANQGQDGLSSPMTGDIRGVCIAAALMEKGANRT